MVFSCAIFWKSLSRIGNSCFQNLWQNSPVKFSCPGCFSVGRFCEYSFGNLCLWLACSYFLFLSGSVLESSIFLRMCTFLPCYPFYWHIFPLMIFCISVLSDITYFSFSILLIWVFLFFLMSLANDLSILFSFSKNQIFVVLIFPIVYFFFFFSFISALMFMISFLLLTLGGFVLLFCCFSAKLDCVFDGSLVSWGRLVLVKTSLLALLLLHPIGFESLCFHSPRSW